MIAQFPKNRHVSVRACLKELCKFKYLQVCRSDRVGGKFDKTIMNLYHRPYETGQLTETQVDVLFSKEFLTGKMKDEELKEILPYAVFHNGLSTSENQTQRNNNEAHEAKASFASKETTTKERRTGEPSCVFDTGNKKNRNTQRTSDNIRYDNF